ncbi:MAG: phosphate ABC transporter permease family protein, partial [Sphingomonadaceae bacterium]|nr:phosphate ABC transporter permease family protein [Sphingomonadaceae bacterium]
MISLVVILAILGLGLTGWFAARARARLIFSGRGSLHSVPDYHGWHMAIWVVVPALAVWIVWSSLTPGMVEEAMLSSPAGQELPEFGMERDAALGEARTLAANPDAIVFNPVAARLAEPARAAMTRYGLIGAGLVFVFAFVGGAYGYTRVRAGFPARTRVERSVMLVLLFASLVAILTTFGIIASLVYEAGLFFKDVSPIDFLTGLHWSPGNAGGADIGDDFGAVPLFWGTLFIGAIIAMIVAIPLGLMSAIFLTQYASYAMRKWLKPMLEILAGIPTVVYGYFAALTV